MALRPAGLLAVVCAAAALAAPADLGSGLDLAAIDRSVRPQDDLYRFANGRWLDAAEIPVDRVAYGTFVEMADRTEADIHDAIEQVLATPHRPKGSPLQQMADFYTSFVDEHRVDAAGAAPLQPELDRIERIRNASQFAAEAGYMTLVGAGGAFGANVVSDARDPKRLLVQVSQGGTRLPTRDYYLLPDLIYQTAREKYQQYLTTVFTLVGRSDPAGDARDVLRLETAIARAQLPTVESREVSLSPRPVSLSELMKSMPGFDWKAWARTQGIDRYPAVILQQPAFFKAFAALVPTIPLDTWKAWLVARHIYQLTPYLSRPFVEARFDLFGRFLQGQTELPARWKGGVALLNMFLSDEVGQLYVQRHFSPAARAHASRIVSTVVLAYRQAIADSSWLSRGTKNEALKKLANLVPRIGAPDRWRDYSGLEMSPDDLIGNYHRAQAFYNDDRLARETGQAQPGGWLGAVQTVNAYYSPSDNEIVLPAAFLQPPIFDAEADDAVNYGALGATVGHELSHAFDDRGRRFDARGNVRAWWTEAEMAHYRAQSQALVDIFDQLPPVEGLRVNGELTLDENLADLIGVSVAYRAYLLSLDGSTPPIIDGFTGPQRFFLGYARMWRLKVRPDYLRQWLSTLPYSPEAYRTDVSVAETDGFYTAFGVSNGDRQFRPPDRRVRIW